MKFSTIVFTAMLAGLFFFTLTGFAVNLMSDNNADFSLLDGENSYFNDSFYQLGGELSETQNTSTIQLDAFTAETPTVGTDSFLFESVIGAFKVFGGTWKGIYNLTLGLAAETLGINEVIFNTFTAIILTLILFAGWRLLKQGE